MQILPLLVHVSLWHRSQVGASPRVTGPCKPAAPAHLAAPHGRVCLLPNSSSKSPAADFFSGFARSCVHP